MARLIISLPANKAKRLGKHLLIEHPITKGRIKLNGSKLSPAKKKK